VDKQTDKQTRLNALPVGNKVVKCAVLKCCQVNIGIIDANPSSTAGVIDIMAHLHRHVPRPDNNDDSLVVIPTHGDSVAVERMIDAQRARAADLSPAERLQGLEPIPQEFHHRALMLQVR